MDRIIKKCKVCPVECELIISKDPKEASGLTVEGNSCNRGRDFAIHMMAEPMEVLTGRVLLKNANMGRLPVKTTAPIPQNKMEECLKILNSTEISAPVKRGQVIIKNILGLGVDVIASRKVNAIGGISS
ncbi:MAG: DUF1667 domain-containing protein [Tissierellia bacterium]|nr:DUF1667 domain-containing protein [Tissierellia bacterium]